MKLWICFVLLGSLLLTITNAKPYGRHRRQFPFGTLNGGNQIFFDDDDFFNDEVVQQNGGDPSSATSRPPGSTTVAIPGMGTTQTSCETRCLTTPQYDPVCGDNNITYNNLARYQCAIRCGLNIRIKFYRACPSGPIGR